MSKDETIGNLSRKRPMPSSSSNSASTSSAVTLPPASNSPSQFAKEYTRVKFVIYLDVTEASMQNECHTKRLQNLRKELNYIKNTDWQYDLPFQLA